MPDVTPMNLPKFPRIPMSQMDKHGHIYWRAKKPKKIKNKTWSVNKQRYLKKNYNGTEEYAINLMDDITLRHIKRFI